MEIITIQQANQWSKSMIILRPATIPAKHALIVVIHFQAKGIIIPLANAIKVMAHTTVNAP